MDFSLLYLLYITNILGKSLVGSLNRWGWIGLSQIIGVLGRGRRESMFMESDKGEGRKQPLVEFQLSADPSLYLQLSSNTRHFTATECFWKANGALWIIQRTICKTLWSASRIIMQVANLQAEMTMWFNALNHQKQVEEIYKDTLTTFNSINIRKIAWK